MEEKIHVYENADIRITYDARRCIHAAECVKGLRSVFDPQKRPWIQPEHAGADSIAEIITRCPTGALHYERKDRDELEAEPARNTISIVPDGPVYLRGMIEIRDHEDNLLKRDTRFALCRCGKSGNKPACDNTHSSIEFEAPGHFDRNALKEDNQLGERDTLVLKVMENGPILVQGSFQIYSVSSQPAETSGQIALCRCGGSSNKPFCDGTHKKIGFKE